MGVLSKIRGAIYKVSARKKMNANWTEAIQAQLRVHQMAAQTGQFSIPNDWECSDFMDLFDNLPDQRNETQKDKPVDG